MNQQKNQGMKIIKTILGILMILSFLFFILGEILLPAENIADNSTFDILRTDWVRINPDGTEEPFTVPGSCNAARGEWVTITTTLPANQEDTWVCIRSMQQELKIYVGNELRKEYSTLDKQLFGKTSTMTYVFFQVSEADASDTLRIEFMTNSSYSGYVSEIYTGEMSDITKHFYGLYAPSTIVAAFMLLISLLVVCCSLFVRLFYKKKVDILHLGNGTT